VASPSRWALAMVMAPIRWVGDKPTNRRRPAREHPCQCRPSRKW
jgi:hypothetical protein